MEKTRGGWERGSLNEQRGQGHEKDDIEDGSSFFHSCEQREGGENDRNGAAKPGPGDEEPFAPRKASSGERNENAERPCNEHQKCRNEQAGNCDGR